MTEALRILALDLSLTRSGYCLGSGLAGCETGVLETSRLRGMERLDRIVREVQSLARGCDLVVIEGYSFGSKGRAVFDVAELGGCVRFLLHRLGTRYVDVPPSTLKKFATGKGNSPKDAMIAAAIRRFGFAGSDNNEADAFLLWCMARHAYQCPVVSLPQLQAAALEAVTWPELKVCCA